jgi:release factor glutamine methyltransferase
MMTLTAQPNLKFLHEAGEGRADLFKRELRQLVEKTTHQTWLDVMTGDYDLKEEEKKTVMQGLGQRALGIPLAHILGTSSFLGLDLELNPKTFIPRPETEILVSAALRWLRKKKLTSIRVLDLGTGSGNIPIALCMEHSDLQVDAVDSSEDALHSANINIKKYGFSKRIRLMKRDYIREGIHDLGQYDMIVSNPPYVALEEAHELQQEVLREPHEALFGGPKGWEILEWILGACPKALKSSGVLFCEMGKDQVGVIARFIHQNASMQLENCFFDEQGVARIVEVRPWK